MSNYLTKSDIEKYITEKKLIVRPLLDPSQIGNVSIDLRLGYDFLLPKIYHDNNINLSYFASNNQNLNSFYDEYRRQPGEDILITPNQTILASSLEFVKIPDDCLATLYMRTSYLKLWFRLSALYQPGYKGCILLELTNCSNFPIKLVIGSRMFQMCLQHLDLNEQEINYFGSSRKYVCQVRPEPSEAFKDKDINVLTNWLN